MPGERMDIQLHLRVTGGIRILSGPDFGRYPRKCAVRTPGTWNGSMWTCELPDSRTPQ
jgi:hypothetical protein